MVKQTNTPIMMLFPIENAKKFSDKYLFLGRFLSRVIFSLKYDLQKSEIHIDPERYCLASLISAFIYSIMFIFVGLAFGAIITREIGVTTIIIMIILSISSFFGMLLFHLLYPKLASFQIAGLVDQDLLFALRTMLIQLSSGQSLFESIKNISKSNYGQVSKEFSLVVRDINSGISETEALEKLAFGTKSDILKKTAWQMITTLRSGGSIVNALNSQVEALVAQQMDSIKAYSAELNLWTLVYLIVAAAVPSLGITFLVIASSIGGSGIGPEAVILIVLLSMIIQMSMIMLIRSKVPKVVK
ncbi:MAG: type II secretion system F family protein [Candidatus ainarchaeum sp.]|jgi:archaeal flagellar protein FlaJ|nr:type II secretion system F family protein [Candidatus ainarchaeum sp.]MDD4128680.1 type II secretion system F family protein [Candidatus ainarchaeum sp.]